MFLATAFALAAAAGAPQASAGGTEQAAYATVTRRGGRLGSSLETVELWRGSTGEHGFTSSVTDVAGRQLRRTARLAECPAARAPLAALAALQPAPWIPGITPQSDQIVVAVHAAHYTLQASLANRGSPDGAISMGGSSGSALADWADGLLAALSSCWRTVVP